MPGRALLWASARRSTFHAKASDREVKRSYCGVTTVTALSWLSRRIWPYALLGVIALWWLYGWHVGVTALFASYGLYEKQVASQIKARLGTRASVTTGSCHGYPLGK